MVQGNRKLSRMPCFLTWSYHRRSKELGRRLSVRLVELVSRHRGVLRYLDLVTRTLFFLVGARPRLVIVQNPSLVLAALVLAIKPILRYATIIDAHNEAVEPYLHSSRPALWLTRLVLRRADRVIVTNESLADIVRKSGGVPVVLPDPVPEVPVRTRRPNGDEFRVVVVSTYAADEPLAEIIEAARIVGTSMRFFVTGNRALLPSDLAVRVPDNMTLTGFLSDSEYWELLASSSVILDLTKMPNCLVCGAYEALAVGVPAILSDNLASVETFGGFAEFTRNEGESIAEALVRVRARHAAIAESLGSARAKYETAWQGRLQHLQSHIEQVSSDTAVGAS